MLKTQCRIEGEKTYFIIADLDTAYHKAVEGLAFMPYGEGFAKGYPTNTSHLDVFYQLFATSAEEMVLQAVRVHPVPWEQALHAFLQRLDGQDIHWWLAGSAALAVRGLNVFPRDLDLVTDDAGAYQLADILFDALIGPVEDTGGWISRWFARAFLHARIEWIGGVVENIDENGVTEYGPTAARRLETVSWQGYELRVPPLDVQLQVNERRGLDDRVQMIKRAIYEMRGN